MALRYDSLEAFLAHGYDQVIDVRSPAEFAEDHVPGAINLPALNNEERAQIGTLYAKVSPFDARKTGAALVARNVATHLETALRDRDGSWRPLVYCWRGGQRSGSFASVLAQVGWRAGVVDGGYQSFRRLVYNRLYNETLPHRFVLLDGNTGTAKTDVLNRLKHRGFQVLDLEGAAGHRGSLLGRSLQGQPSQKSFESDLAIQISRLDPARPVLLEAESSKIGDRIIPPMIWKQMKNAPRLEVSAPLDMRAAYLVETYNDIIADEDSLRQKLDVLRRFRGHDVVDKWHEALSNGDHQRLARSLMQDHYDLAYARSRGVHAQRIDACFEAGALDEKGREALADKVALYLNLAED